MTKKVLITGGTGLIGKALTDLLLKNGIRVSFLSRNNSPHGTQNVCTYKWDIAKGYIDPDALQGISHIIHLAGANIGSKRWTKNRKREIINSRIQSTKLLLEYTTKYCNKLSSFIAASAIGYYGSKTTQNIYKETDAKGDDFFSHVCALWEAEASIFESLGIRTVILRTAIVLSVEGGALHKMSVPAKLGLGAAIGSGEQYIPWIHIKDLCNMYLFAIENDIKGIFNAVASEHISNKMLSSGISQALNKPHFMPNIPAWIIKCLLGEMSLMLLEGSRISNQKIRHTGFDFEHNKVLETLDNLL